MRALIAAAALAAFATPAAAQDFVAEFNTVGSPMTAQDKRVAVDATGPMQAWRGRPWWHVLAYCSGVYEYTAYRREETDPAGAEALREQGNDLFFRPGIRRLMEDRGIDADAGAAVMQPDVNFHMIVTGEEGRPFEEDRARCRTFMAAYAAAIRPAAAAPAAPTPAPAPPGDRRFKAQADLTRRFDGEPYWELMLRCAAGSQGVAGQRGQMMGLFTRTAMQLLTTDRGLTREAAEAELRARLPQVQPIAPGTSPTDDACIAIGQQLQAEVAGG
jgi:hypothetical protein